MMETFPCTSCGACCRSLKGANQYTELDRGDGVCLHFNEQTSQCSIYEDRPIQCRIGEMYELFFRAELTRMEFYRLNGEACNGLQEKMGIDESFRVRVE